MSNWRAGVSRRASVSPGGSFSSAQGTQPEAALRSVKLSHVKPDHRLLLQPGSENLKLD